MKSIFTLLSLGKQLWPYYVAAVVFSVLMSLTALASPFLVKIAIDMAVEATQGGTVATDVILWVAVGILVADVLNTMFTNIGGYYGDILSARLKKHLSDTYYKHLLALPQSYYDGELTGTVINRLNRTILELTQFINMFVNSFFQMFLTMFLTLGIVALYSWELAILLILLYPIFLWLTALTSKKWQVWQDKKNLVTDIASGRFAEVISQMRVVKSFIQEPREFSLFSGNMTKTIDITKEQARYWHKMDAGRRLVLNGVFFAIFAYLFVNTIQGRFSIGEMALIIQLLQYIRFPIFNLSFIIDNIQKAVAGSKEYLEVLSLEPAVKDAPNAQPLQIKKGAISFNDITFGYERNAPVLKGLSLSVPARKKMALVGESGQGKTTLTSLLLRLYDVQSGGITIDGQDISDCTQKSLRENIAVVFQEPALFSGTIFENIAYAQPDASLKQVEDAARAANAHTFIQKLDDGYETEIGERGLKLSGGQKQRIAIARALLKDAPILLLDEATSSLDSKSERSVQQALERLMRKRTTIIIAHRLSTVEHVDMLATIKDGVVDECGSPSELAKTGGIYSTLLDLQQQSTDATKKELKSYEMSA